jgi:hypothetical protein
MCEPTTLMALQVATAAVSVYGQQQAASAQAEANQRQYDNIMRARAANINQTNLMQQQEREGAMQRMEENNLKGAAAQATARTAAGESGISGLSVDSLLADLGTKQNRFNSSVETNYDRSSQAIAIQRENVDTNAASQINQLKTPTMPDYFSAALRIGNAAYRYNNNLSPQTTIS